MSAGADLVLDVRAALGEGPVWDARDGGLRFLDVDAPTLHTYTPATGAHDTLALGRAVTAIAPCGADAFVAATRTGFALLTADGALCAVADVTLDGVTAWLNDGTCDRHGRFWAGVATAAHDPGRGVLYRLDGDRATAVLDGVGFSNGLGFSPDGGTLYYADSARRTVTAYPFAGPDGTLGTPAAFVALAPDDGRPDGLAVDAEGGVWVAVWGSGQVRRYAPDGAVTAVVDVGVRQVTSCAFGGPDLATLFITTGREDDGAAPEPTAGGLFAASVGVRGLPAAGFAGAAAEVRA